MVSESKGVQCKNYTLCSLIFCVKYRKFHQTLLMIIFQWYFQNPMYQNFIPQPQNFYGGMPPGINWQQEITNRLNTLQNQIQNSFTNQNNASSNNINQGFLIGRISGSKEEVLSAQVDFEPQFFPVGNEVIYVKKLVLDGKSQVLEYRLTIYRFSNCFH